MAFFRYEREFLSVAGELKTCIKKIAIVPNSEKKFLACGKSYLKHYECTERNFRERNDMNIAIKYERENEFIDALYILENVFVTVTA